MSDAEQLVTLWDGKRYARSVIEARWPRVADCANTYHRLIENIEFPRAFFMRKNLKRGAIISGFFFVMFLLIAYFDPGDDKPVGSPLEAVVAAALLSAFCFGFTVLLAIFRRFALEGRFPIIFVVENGIVHVTKYEHTSSYKIDEIQWYVATTVHGGKAFVDFPKRKAIVLLMSSNSKSPYWAYLSARHVVCGLTDDSFLCWHAMLTLSDARELEIGRIGIYVKNSK